VARDEADKKTKQPSLPIHHIICDNQLLHQNNEGLRTVLKIKQKSKPFDPRERNPVNGGAK
jgi:hypothetical protein